MNNLDQIDLALHSIITRQKEYDRQRKEASEMLEATAKDSMLANLKEIQTILSKSEKRND